MNERTNNPILCAMALSALYEVIDPELNVNVVDLGLIYAIDFKDSTIDCEMTLTTQFCPMGDAISQGVRQALERAFPNHIINLNLTFDPPWSREFISEEGLYLLNN